MSLDNRKHQESVDDTKPRSLRGRKPTTTPLGTSITENISPYPIVGATFVGPVSDAPFGIHHHNFSRLEMTPLYIGQLHTTQQTTTTNQWNVWTVPNPDTKINNEGLDGREQREEGSMMDKKGSEGGNMNAKGGNINSKGGNINAMRIGGAVESFAWSGVSRGTEKSKTEAESWKGLPEGQTSGLLKGIPSPDPGVSNDDILICRYIDMFVLGYLDC